VDIAGSVALMLNGETIRLDGGIRMALAEAAGVAGRDQGRTTIDSGILRDWCS
jgi:hypothetical protein